MQQTLHFWRQSLVGSQSLTSTLQHLNLFQTAIRSSTPMTSSLLSGLDLNANRSVASRAKKHLEKDGKYYFTKNPKYIRHKPTQHNTRKKKLGPDPENFVVINVDKILKEMKQETEEEKERWNISATCIVHRSAIIIKELPKWSTDYQTLMQSKRPYDPYKLLEMLAPNIKDKIREMQEVFDPDHDWSSRITDADKANDRRSLRRRLDETMYLVLKRKSDGKWEFPSKINELDESLSQTALRQTNDLGGDAFTSIIGYHPCGHYDFEYPNPQGEKIGERTFFYRCGLFKKMDPVYDTNKYSDFNWIAKDELGEYFEDEKLVQFFNSLLWDPMEA